MGQRTDNTIVIVRLVPYTIENQRERVVKMNTRRTLSTRSDYFATEYHRRKQKSPIVNLTRLLIQYTK